MCNLLTTIPIAYPDHYTMELLDGAKLEEGKQNVLSNDTVPIKPKHYSMTEALPLYQGRDCSALRVPRQEGREAGRVWGGRKSLFSGQGCFTHLQHEGCNFHCYALSYQ